MKRVRANFHKMIQCIKENRVILIILGLLFLERIYAAYTVGITYNLDSDDLSYIKSGITFLKTGSITMHGVLSAQIMPGMPVLIGILAGILGEGRMLWFGLKLLWFLMGTGAAYYVYKTVLLFAPKWCGYLAVLPFFCADFVWMDNLILTETPFMLFFVIMIYATIRMGRTHKWIDFWMCLAAYMMALMFKANIALYPIFAFVYLIIARYNFKLLIKQGIILGCIILSFVIPWSIRNYIYYDAFIPLTWGAGNPMLLGTYQGRGYPLDEELDYEKNVDEVAKRKFQKFYNENGETKETYLEKYVALEKDMIKAKYRMSVWFENNPINMIESYLYLKPKLMVESLFYWEPILDVTAESLMTLKEINYWICILTLIAAVYIKKYRKEIFFLSAVYIGNIYIYAMTFAFERYSATLMPLRFIVMGISPYLVGKLIIKLWNEIKIFDKSK